MREPYILSYVIISDDDDEHPKADMKMRWTHVVPSAGWQQEQTIRLSQKLPGGQKMSM